MMSSALDLSAAVGVEQRREEKSSPKGQKEIELQDVIIRSLAREVSFTSFNNRKQKVCQIGNSLGRIRDYMFRGEKLCIFPQLKENETNEVITSLHARIRHIFSEGFVFTATSLASAANIACSSSSSPASLQDVLLLIPDRPGCFFSVVKADSDPQARDLTMKHVVSLSKGIVKTLRKFCNVQFSLVYGIVTVEKLVSDNTFGEALDRIVDKTSQWSVPVALTMPQEKYLKIVEAFILSISIVQCLSNSKANALWCLTLDQFRTIQENLQQRKVKVKVMSHCCQRVLMLELAARLDKMTSTTLVSNDDKLRATAKKQKTCAHVVSSDEFSKTREGTSDLCIVTDCGKEIAEISDINCTIWTFVKMPGDYQLDADISLKKEKALDTPKFSVMDGMIEDVFERKPIGYTESSSILSLSRTMKVLSLTGNETSRKFVGPEVSLRTQVGIYKGISGSLVNLPLSGFLDPNYRSESQIHLLERSKHEIETYTRDTIKLDIVETAVTKLQINRTLVITGLPGEGKTTLGYMVLKEYLDRGRHVYVVRSPEEFFSITNLDNSLVMFNDLFGSFLFDQSDLGKWIPVFENLCRRSQNAMTLFVSRDYVFDQAMRKLEKFANLLFSRNTILNLTISNKDKKEIYKSFQKKNTNVHSLSDTEIDELVENAFPYGFAHYCNLFFSLDTGKYPMDFFRNPRLFLDATIATHYHNDTYRRVVFHLLLYGEGLFDISKLIVADKISATQFEIIHLLDGVVNTSQVLASAGYAYHFGKLQESFESMCGLFLEKEGHLVRFKHTSIHESVANVICHKNTKFIIEHCNVNSLDYFIHVDKNGLPMSHLNSPLPRESLQHLVSRFCLEMQKGHLLPVLRHSLFTTSKGVALFFSLTDIEKVIELSDVKLEHSFCYLACSNGDDKLLTEMISIVKFSTEMVQDVICGCCEFGNKAGLLLIQSLMRDQKFRYSSAVAEKACLLAVENDHPEIVELLLADMNSEQRHGFGHNKSFLLAAMKGQKEVVEILLDIGVFVNTADSNGWTALHHASDQGNIDLVSLLLLRGCGVNIATKEGLTPSHIATRSGHVEVMRTLHRRGGNIRAITNNGETLLHMAALSGKIYMFKEILTYRLDNSKRTIREGETALFYAAKTNFIEAVEVMTFVFVLTNREKNTILHIAVKQGFRALVKLLLTKWIGILFVPFLNVPNKEGCYPIHCAAQIGDEHIIIQLLKFSSSDINISGPNGESPLCISLRKSHKKACHRLLLKGACVNHKCKNGSIPLHLAVQHNWDSATVKAILQRGADVNSKTIHNHTALSLAVNKESLDLVKLLLSFNADVNISDTRGMGPLHYACLRGHVEITEQLLKAETCDVEQTDVDGNTALVIASLKGSSELVQCLILRGAKLEKRTRNMETSLIIAAKNGHLRAAEILVNAGSEVNTQAKDGSSALYNTSSKNFVQLVALLLDNGADVDIRRYDDKTPLHTAADIGNIQVVQMLLDHGADVNHGDNRQWSAYHFAIQNGFIDIVKLLLARGGDENKQTIEGMTGLHLACCRGHRDLVLFLIQYGCRLDLVDKSGLNILHVASAFTDRKMLFFLFARGLDPNATANKGVTALHLAAEKGNLEIARELIDRGADVYAKTSSGDSTLTISCFRGHDDLVALLITRGAQLEVENKSGMTPLIYAAIFNHCKIIERLLLAGADVDHSDIQGQTPLHMAAVRGHKGLVDVLLISGAQHKLTVNGFLPFEYAFVGLHYHLYMHLALNTPGVAMVKRLLLVALQVTKLQR